MNSVSIELWQLGLVLGLLLLTTLGVSKSQKLDLEKDLLLGSFRAAIQLVAVGYVLLFVFEQERPEWVFLVLAVMLGVGSFTAARRVEHGPGRKVLVPRMLLAIASGSALALLPVFAWVIVPTPAFSPRYIIPISGMIVANAMNVVAQVSERMFAGARNDAAEIEQWLALGASPAQALARQTREALRAAMIPTINSLFTVGLVSLPGMMTGQIVGGASPDHAVRYQIVIMYQLVIVAAVSGGVAATLARRMLFNDRSRLQRF